MPEAVSASMCCSEGRKASFHSAFLAVPGLESLSLAGGEDSE